MIFKLANANSIINRVYVSVTLMQTLSLSYLDILHKRIDRASKILIHLQPKIIKS